VPTYGFKCSVCEFEEDRVLRIDDRNEQQFCSKCDQVTDRQVSSALFKFKGQVTPGGGPDRFTADQLGIPLKELPSGLRFDKPRT
jgi:putative FmdB family regulatory protein